MEPPSLLVLRQVIDWALEQGMSIRDLLSAEQLAELGRVFSNQRPWSFELYEPLRALSHALPRLELPDLPARVQLGDALTALNHVLVRDAAAAAGDGAYGTGLARHAWPIDMTVSRHVFSELDYANTSAGISELRARNRTGWQEHAEHNKRFLMHGAEMVTGGSAAVIGAGKLYDVPLKHLAERFEHLVLIDVDGAALAESVEQVLGENALRGRVTLLTCDVTGSNATFVAAARPVLDEAGTDAAAYQGLLELLYSVRFESPLELAPLEPLLQSCSVVFSTMVLSQLAVPLTDYVQRGFVARFPGSSLLRQPQFQTALKQFTHRVQHAHLESLLALAQVAVISSDVSEQLRQVAAGQERVSAPLPLLGAPSLQDLLPAASTQLLARAEWRWPRVVPTPKKPHGRLLQVNGCVARRRSA